MKIPDFQKLLKIEARINLVAFVLLEQFELVLFTEQSIDQSIDQSIAHICCHFCN